MGTNERTLFILAVVATMVWIGVQFGLEIARIIPMMAHQGSIAGTTVG